MGYVMEPREAGKILATMQGAWNGFAADDVSSRLWLGYIGSQTPDVATAAARRLIETSQYKPSVAAWQEACRTERRRVESTTPALAEPGRDPNGLERLEEIRDLLAAHPPPPTKHVASDAVALEVDSHRGGHAATFEELTMRQDWQNLASGDWVVEPERASSVSGRADPGAEGALT